MSVQGQNLPSREVPGNVCFSRNLPFPSPPAGRVNLAKTSQWNFLEEWVNVAMGIRSSRNTARFSCSKQIP
jgi:hypothetical protein